jgi:hypothetical protein
MSRGGLLVSSQSAAVFLTAIYNHFLLNLRYQFHVQNKLYGVVHAQYQFAAASLQTSRTCANI